MRFLAARYNAIGAEKVSVLVQHYAYQGEQICFVGIAEKDEVTEQLYRCFWKEIIGVFLKNPVRCMKRMRKKLRRRLKILLHDMAESSPEDVSFAFLLCIGEEFLSYKSGDMRVACFNTAFGRSHMSYLEENCGLDVCYGSVEEDVAFLLATSGFCEKIGHDLLQEVLFVGEAKKEWQMEKRLSELAREKMQDSSVDGGALLVRSCVDTMGDVSECERGQEAREELSEGNAISEFGTCSQHVLVSKQILGKGAFSKVIKVQADLEGKVYACKKSRDIAMLQREYNVGKRLDHPLFLKVYEGWQEGEEGFLLMEFVPGTDVKHLLERRGHFTEKQTIRIGMELAEGLLYLHEREGFLFRDIKPDNIIIRQDGRVKLLDLGCVCKREVPANSRAGSPGFAAPEQFVEHKRLDVTCDVYGLASTMIEMLGSNLEKCKKLRTLLEICTEENPGKRIPDMRLFLNLLGEISEGKSVKMTYKKGLLCYKNIWERKGETA